MPQIDDGDPVFLFPQSYIGKDAPHEGIGGGAELRDWFAGTAADEDVDFYMPALNTDLAALLSQLGIEIDLSENVLSQETRRTYGRLHAWARYQFADAMMAERARRKNSDASTADR